MKYYKRLKKYKANNVELCVETKQAHSYGWWMFLDLMPDNETLVFNGYNYSKSTSRHQSKVQTVMHQLGWNDRYKVVYISSPKSIGNGEFFKSAIQLLVSEKDMIITIMSTNRRKKSLDSDRYMRLNEIEVEIAEINRVEKLYNRKYE